MNAATAKALLQNIRTQKVKAGIDSAGVNPDDYPKLTGLSSWMPSVTTRNSFSVFNPATWIPTSNPVSNDLSSNIHKYQNQQLQSDAKKDIITAIALAGGIGAAVRGISGLQNWATDSRISPERVVEMPVPYGVEKEKEEKKAFASDTDSEATSKIGLGYYLPSMLLGSSLAAYGGWKGIDALFKNQQTSEREKELENAKKDYESALLGSYKTATDNALDSVFAKLQKPVNTKVAAILPQFIRDMFPNLEGASKGALLTSALVSAPLGYMVVNSAMKKNSQRAILNKAVAERARRQALEQPPEIYAIPVPKEV